MFENLTQRLNGVFDKLRRRGKLSERDVDEAMREVRLALLEADVHYKVTKDFVARLRERAVGREVSRALNPGQQVIKIVHEEMIATLGEPAPLDLHGPKPRLIMLAGLQGSGKTTAAGKLAHLLRAQGERILLVAADPYRPAAVQQLQTLGERLDIEVFSEPGIAPPEIVKKAHARAQKGGFSVAILDTAGRSQLDNQLMAELRAIHQKVELAEVLLVVDAMIGQEAVNIAQGFREAVPLTGLILTKMDGDARGGAAISIRSVTGVPIKFLGTGEGLDALEVYDPARLSSRILGMGDVIGLIERAEAAFDEEIAEQQASRMLSGEFSLDDFAKQLQQVRKMGPIGQLLELMPGGMGRMANAIDPRDAEKQFKKTEAILSSMTTEERLKPKVLDASRRRRIASGSGTQVQDVNQLIKQYQEARNLMKRIKKSGMRGMAGLFG
ncbi:MAG: signal recognition particle protein [Chloroflexi bacterium]|nr:signal recognition particle protein [Chloroflexota bacterium]